MHLLIVIGHGTVMIVLIKCWVEGGDTRKGATTTPNHVAATEYAMATGSHSVAHHPDNITTSKSKAASGGQGLKVFVVTGFTWNSILCHRMQSTHDRTRAIP